MAGKLGISEQAVRKRAGTPDKYGWKVKKMVRKDGGTGRLEIRVDEQFPMFPETAETGFDKNGPADQYDSGSEDLTNSETAGTEFNKDWEFENLLAKKMLGRSRSLGTYYRGLYRKTGVIPRGLHTSGRDGRMYSGRRPSVDEDVERRFVEIITRSANDPIESPDFKPNRLRKVTHFHEQLEEEFEKKISLQSLWRIVREHDLRQYFIRPDSDDEKFVDNAAFHYPAIPVFDLIQVDGCTLRYFKIQNQKGEWQSPHIIECYDTGSRYMLTLEAYFSESYQSCTDLFCKFMASCRFPNRNINFRPDNALGFLNLKRPIREINRKYMSLNGFFLNDDYAAPLNAKAKVHLERSHGNLHSFEDFIIRRATKDCDRVDRKIETRVIGGRVEKVAITYLDMVLKEFRGMGFLEEYQERHNKRKGKFTENGIRKEWCPENKFNEFSANQTDSIRFAEKDIESLRRYGYPKELINTPKGKVMVYKKHRYRIISGHSKLRRCKKVRVSEHEGTLHFFEDADDGIHIGDAKATRAPERSEKRERHKKDAKQEQNEFDLICVFLENAGLSPDESNIRNLYYFEGLTLEITMDLVNTNRAKYEKYAGTDKGFIAFNLFCGDFVEYKNSQVDPVKHVIFKEMSG